MLPQIVRLAKILGSELLPLHVADGWAAGKIILIFPKLRIFRPFDQMQQVSFAIGKK